MKKLKITKNNKVSCTLHCDFIDISVCRSCDDCFGVIPFSHVNCKRGLNKDEYLNKQRNKGYKNNE